MEQKKNWFVMSEDEHNNLMRDTAQEMCSQCVADGGMIGYYIVTFSKNKVHSAAVGHLPIDNILKDLAEHTTKAMLQKKGMYQ